MNRRVLIVGGAAWTLVAFHAVAQDHSLQKEGIARQGYSALLGKWGTNDCLADLKH